jgi:hypothetical protein
MGLFKEYKTDSVKESSGIVITFDEAQNADGSIPSFTLSRMGKSNVAFSKALESATRPYRRQMELGLMKNDVAETLFLKVFVETVLRDWENIQSEDGISIAFTPENAISLLTELPDVYERLQTEAKLASNFRSESLIEESKN